MDASMVIDLGRESLWVAVMVAARCATARARVLPVRVAACCRMHVLALVPWVLGFRS